MESVDFIHGAKADERILGGQREKHERIAVFAGADYMIAYNYSGKSFLLDTTGFIGADIYLMRPAVGVYSYAGKMTGDRCEYVEMPCYNGDEDVVVVIRKA